MKNIGGLMKQAQAMQQKLAEAQARLAKLEVDGIAGDGMVKLVLKGTGASVRIDIDEAMMAPGEGEMVADLIVAAHADAKRQLDAQQAELMSQAAGPMAGMGIPGLPKF